MLYLFQRPGQRGGILSLAARRTIPIAMALRLVYFQRKEYGTTAVFSQVMDGIQGLWMAERIGALIDGDEGSRPGQNTIIGTFQAVPTEVTLALTIVQSCLFV